MQITNIFCKLNEKIQPDESINYIERPNSLYYVIIKSSVDLILVLSVIIYFLYVQRLEINHMIIKSLIFALFCDLIFHYLMSKKFLYMITNKYIYICNINLFSIFNNFDQMKFDESIKYDYRSVYFINKYNFINLNCIFFNSGGFAHYTVIVDPDKIFIKEEKNTVLACSFGLLSLIYSNLQFGYHNGFIGIVCLDDFFKALSSIDRLEISYNVQNRGE